MSEVEIPVMRVMVIRQGSPAWGLIVDAIPIEVGQIIPCTAEQLESLRNDCLILDVPTAASP